MSAAEKGWINPFGNGKTAEAIIKIILEKNQSEKKSHLGGRLFYSIYRPTQGSMMALQGLSSGLSSFQENAEAKKSGMVWYVIVLLRSGYNNLNIKI